MLGPDSRLLIALLITGSAALLVALVRFRPLPLRALCGALSIVVAMAGGIAFVNHEYGYYTSWGQLWADFHDSTGNLGVISTDSTSAGSLQSGQIGWIDLPGKLSGYDRRGLVYLPPQYGQAKYAHTQFPVLELFHGTPGTPLTWQTLMRISQVMNDLLAKHQIGPMVLVMPSINGSGHDFQDCVNGPSVNDDTYLTTDVRNDVIAHYRVSRDAYEWGMAGYSSGGFCAANLALRHRDSFGAAAVINGYFRAADGPAGSALHRSVPLENANSPLYLAERLKPDGNPLPAFWVAAGTHDKADYTPATLFAAALDRIEQVPFVNFQAGDTANAWSAALPVALSWLWQELAPSDLRVLFPARGQTSTPATLTVPPAKTSHPGQCKPGSIAGPGRPPCGPHVPATSPTAANKAAA